MTSRQAGRRIASLDQRRRNTGRSARNSRTRKKSEPLSSGDLRRLMQLVACGSIFVAVVAAKLLLPARMASFNGKLSAAMERNMDVQAVFSAVGRAFSGEEGGGVEELYQAVFHPQTEAVSENDGASQAEAAPRDDAGAALTSMKSASHSVKLQDGAALETLRSYREDTGISDKDSGASPEPVSAQEGTPDASDLAYILYSQENLPDKVSMEQAILGFDYSPPVKGTVSSDFGYREHPVEGEERFHYGVDLAADTGTEVDSFADGTITAVGESSSYGRYCVVSHQGGFSTLYAHCSRITASSGAAVSRGQKIAEVGETGMATGPHLHFELQRDGTYLNPIYYVSSL